MVNEVYLGIVCLCRCSALSSHVPVLASSMSSSLGRLHAIDQDTMIKMTVINPCRDISLQEYGSAT